MIKRTLCSLAIIGILIWGSGTIYQHQAKVRGVDYITDEDLQIRYNAYNNEYFEGKLPPAEIHFQKNLHDLLDGTRAMGMTFPGNPYRIYIDAEYSTSPVVAMETEIHEQCHVAVDESVKGPEFEDHGPRFQKCMLRVAEAGGFKGIW